MTKIGIISDLHMDMRLWDWNFVSDPEVFYIVAGDVHWNHRRRQEFFYEAFPDGNYLFVPGNHDFYNGTFPMPGAGQITKFVDGLKIAGATLWTDLSNPENWASYVRNLNDMAMTNNDTYYNYNAAHLADKAFLLDSSAEIIVSHHLPSYQSVNEKYRRYIETNPCFATNLDEAILALPKPPKLWIHGHTHDECDYMLGETRVVCYPRGYRYERPGEYLPKIVEISWPNDTN